MTSCFRRVAFILSLVGFSSVAVVSQKAVPDPVLVFVGHEAHEWNGKKLVQYKYVVENRSDFPNELFAPAPELPPCGRNTKASRTWLDFIDQDGKYIYGFCALADHDELSKISFNIVEGSAVPRQVYVILIDRQTDKRYYSNHVDTPQ